MIPDGLLENSVLVVAHPDDEALWFSTILRRVSRVIVCFRPSVDDPDADRRVREDFPVPNATFLSLATFGGYHPVNYRLPFRNKRGLFIKNSVGAARRYGRNYQVIKSRLTELVPPGSAVFTHNPWGEYGHEEHVQVWAILSQLQPSLKLRLWHSNYGSNKSFPLIGPALFNGRFEQFTLPIDADFTDQLKQYYVDRGCWTWDPDWKWFPDETYFCLDSSSSMPKFEHAPRLNLFNVRY